MSLSIEKLQEEFCITNEYKFLVSAHVSIIGYAVETEGKLPVNGLRLPLVGETNGWYIWCGEEFSENDNFFSPLHTSHLEKRNPEILKLLGLAPGYRFLYSPNYIDIWFDKSLLNK